VTTPSIAVVGPGGVGAFFAAHLIAGGHDVVSCARRPFDTYVIESDTAPVRVPAKVWTDPAEVQGPVDWVLVAVKAHQTTGAAGWLDTLCDHNTTVVALQNGVEGRQRLAPLVNGAEVIPSVVYCGAQLLEPGRAKHTSHGYLIVPDTDKARRLAALYEPTPAEIRTTDSFADQAWRKLAINVIANGLTALTDKPIGVVASAELRPVATAMLAECLAVARAEGATLSDDIIEPMLDGMSGGEGTTSMRQDRQAGRSTEHDALHGAVIRLGAAHSIPTPVHEIIEALITAGDPA